MKKFEYRSEKIDIIDMEYIIGEGYTKQYIHLNELGKNGWELINIINGISNVIGVFKREIIDE